MGNKFTILLFEETFHGHFRHKIGILSFIVDVLMARSEIDYCRLLRAPQLLFYFNEPVYHHTIRLASRRDLTGTLRHPAVKTSSEFISQDTNRKKLTEYTVDDQCCKPDRLACGF